MCLDKIEFFPIRKNVGWKIFLYNSKKKGLCGLYFPPMVRFDRPVLKVGRWLDSKDFSSRSRIGVYRRLGKNQRFYRTGFHIYIRKEEALSEYGGCNRIRQVKFDEIVSRGYQNGRRVVVARKMMILPKRIK